jgi:adenosylhomocysteine nucleosidase
MTTQYVIDKFQPDLIVNMGTAGSSVYDYGTILSINQFVQRDMNTTEFMAPKFVCPQTSDNPILEYGEIDNRYLRGISGTGDTFVRNIACDIWDCVGMEDFAIAWVARENKIPLSVYKFVSDGKNGDTTDKQWSDVLHEAKEKLEHIGREILQI